MENAVKALLIAAAVLLVLMIISLLVISYGQTSNFFENQHDATVTEQLQSFNEQFVNYNNTTIRGNEMLSIINKVVDYNTMQATNKGYEKITLNISGLDSPQVMNQFKYNDADNSIFGDMNILKGTKEISNKVNELLNELYSDIPYITESHLQTLASNIHYIVVPSTGENVTERDIKNRNKVIENTLNVNVEGKELLLEKIQRVAREYYQLAKFKRAKFKCTDIIHSQKSGRVKIMKFELVMDAEGKIEYYSN